MSKILLVCGWYYPNSVGGTEAYVHSLAKNLQSMGHTVTITAPSTSEKVENYIHDGLPVYRYPVSLNPSKKELKNLAPVKYLDIFEDWLKTNRPDLAHIHSLTRGCSLEHAISIKGLGIPLIFTAHTPDITCARGTMMRWGRIPCDGKILIHRCSSCYLNKRGLLFPVAHIASVVLGFKKQIAARKKRLHQFFGLFTHIIAVSEWLHNTLRLNGVPDSKLSILRHGLDQKFIKTQKSVHKYSGILKIGYIGRFNPTKGVHVLINAVKRLPQTMPVELKLYGRTNDEEEIRYFRYIKKISKDDKRIIFSGEVNDNNKEDIFNGLDILAIPSLWLESGPLVMLEAFSFGIPVIGSNSGGIAETIKDNVNGILIPARNIKMWVSALEKLCKNPELLKNMSKHISPMRTSDKVAEEMVALYKKIIT